MFVSCSEWMIYGAVRLLVVAHCEASSTRMFVRRLLLEVLASIVCRALFTRTVDVTVFVPFGIAPTKSY